MNTARMLRNSCTISRKTETVGSSGETTTAWANVATGVACSIQASSGSEAIAHYRETGRKLYDVFFMPDAGVRTKDVLTPIAAGGIGFSVSGTPASLSVKSPATDHSGLGPYLMVVAEEIGGQGAF